MPGVVDRLERHATGEGTIADHRNAFELLTAAVASQGHAQGRRNAGGGVTCPEVIEAALAPFEVARHSALLAQCVELVVAPRDQLVGVGLVAHVPDNPVLVEVEGLVEGQGEFHHTQPWPEMASAGGHHLQMLLTNLTSYGF